MKTIAVILCSKTKKDYPCSVREMYDDSISFKARRMFMDLAYDEWYVNTSKYGFMDPSMVIEPYDSWYIQKHMKGSMLKDDNNILTDEMIDSWVDMVDKQFPNKEEIELHCHLSKPYYDKLATIFPNIRYIKPQRNFQATAWRYYEGMKMFLEGADLESCIKHIEKVYTTGRPKEQPKWFYHNEFGEYYGKGWDLAKQYDIDNGSCYSLSMGSCYMTYGWVTDKELLPHVRKINDRRYRLDKKMPKIDKSWKQEGLGEILKEIDSSLFL